MHIINTYLLEPDHLLPLLNIIKVSIWVIMNELRINWNIPFLNFLIVMLPLTHR